MNGRLILAGIVATATLSGCTRATPAAEPDAPLGRVVVGLRKGEQDAVDPTPEAPRGSRKDLAATLDTAETGWITASWTFYPAGGGLPRQLHWRGVRPRHGAPVFAALPGDTMNGGWEPGLYAVRFEAASGVAMGRVNVP